jgi:hypothetical protein
MGGEVVVDVSEYFDETAHEIVAFLDGSCF